MRTIRAKAGFILDPDLRGLASAAVAKAKAGERKAFSSRQEKDDRMLSSLKDIGEIPEEPREVEYEAMMSVVVGEWVSEEFWQSFTVEIGNCGVEEARMMVEGDAAECKGVDWGVMLQVL
ncbi:hypothetical protein B0A55_03754 [Friedmanniomyces simplex]|uniref:Uncharacterized protein n=1 Tax=Friedmanniomyces simplex TaxID=329884 RepID=A0A4U0XDK9_9PEZI|nr:hypothetical protein B0A55_03754 [Friedmanniomyces simplex]